MKLEELARLYASEPHQGLMIHVDFSLALKQSLDLVFLSVTHILRLIRFGVI